jgi:Protein of unknown function (DUF2752)
VTAHAAHARSRLPELGVATLAVVPAATAWALWHPVAVERTGPALCPFRAMTGLPCPLCGATRAFVYFFHGDGRFLHYNWGWLVVWAGLLAWAAAAVRARARGRPPPLGPLRAHPRLLWALPLVLLPLWAVALANAGPILGH